MSRGQQGWGDPGSGAGEFDHPYSLAYTASSGTLYAVDEGNARVQYLVGSRVAGQRGGAGPGASGLGDPIAVAVAPNGSLVVLDAARKRLVMYAGSAAGSFNAIATPGVPLGIAAGADGALTLTTDGQWSGLSAASALDATHVAAATRATG